MNNMAAVAGWIGMAVLLFAYARRSWLSARTYALLNLVGAALLAVVCFATMAWPAFVLQCIWGLIALGDLVKSPRP